MDLIIITINASRRLSRFGELQRILNHLVRAISVLTWGPKKILDRQIDKAFYRKVTPTMTSLDRERGY
jgi:hypothetical protein